MLSAFLAQYAAGCHFAIAVTAVKLTDWRFVRLMCIVSTALALLAALFIGLEEKNLHGLLQSPAVSLLGSGLLAGFIWLFVNASQSNQVRNSQRALAAGAGAACLAAALWMTLTPTEGAPVDPSHDSTGPHMEQPFDRSFESHRPMVASPPDWAVIVSTVLGAGLLGVATTAMLLGHRYLTDTGMSIAPLAKLTNVYLLMIGARTVWVLWASQPVWSQAPPLTFGAVYFWLAFGVRIGIGLVVAGVFAGMIRDCVRRRATQSATALYYLSMLFILSGELSAQYLLRFEGLAL